MLRRPDGPATVSVASKRQHGCAQITRRIGVRKPAAEGAAVPDLRVGDGAGGLR